MFIHTTHALSPKEEQRHLRYSCETLTFYQNYLAYENTVSVTGGKPIAVSSQSIAGANSINPIVAFHDLHGIERERELLFFYFVPDTTRHHIFIPFCK
jgi:hypothetical protein